MNQKKIRPKAKIKINQAWCKGCGICSEFCPKKVFDRDMYQHPVIAREDDCILCKLCEERCPDFAIEVLKKENDNNQ